MQIEKSDLENIIKETVKATILELGFGKQVPKQNKTAYQKTEQLLYNFRGFQRVVKEKQEQIEEIKKCGYIPYVIHDMGSYNNNKVKIEFEKFRNFLISNQII